MRAQRLVRSQQYLRDRRLEVGRPPTVRAVAHMVKNVLFEYKDQLLAGMIVAGWDAADGPSVFSVPLGGSIMRQKYALGSSGSTYILSQCDAEYRDGMSRSETQQFVARGTLSPHLYSLSFSHIAAISLAMARDCSSGGVVRLVTVDRDGAEYTFIGGDSLPHPDSAI